MLKNKYIKLASILLILCIITTCGVSSTFAKYTTGGTATDSARVAKWGVELAVTSNAFANEYSNGAVVSSDSKKVVAPGTSGTLVEVSVSGCPEVALHYAASLDLNLTGWEYEADNGESAEHCPLVFTVFNGTNSTNAEVRFTICMRNGGIDSVEKLEEKLESEVLYLLLYDYGEENGSGGRTHSSNYAPNMENPGNYVRVEWAWAFSVDDDTETPTINEAKERDKLDTKVATLGTAPTISFSIDISITQLN